MCLCGRLHDGFAAIGAANELRASGMAGGEEGVTAIRGVAFKLGDNVGVGVGGDADLAMTKDLHHHTHGDAQGEQQ
jgi:hypothetical protein